MYCKSSKEIAKQNRVTVEIDLIIWKELENANRVKAN